MQGGVMRCSDIYAQVRALGSWTDETIYQQLMAGIVNLPPARLHWRNVDPFVYLRCDGQCEIFDAKVHPQTVH